MSVARQAQVDLEREKKELEDSFQRISEQAQRKVSGREMYAVNDGGVRPSWTWALIERPCRLHHRQLCGWQPCEGAARGRIEQDMVTDVQGVRSDEGTQAE